MSTRPRFQPTWDSLATYTAPEWYADGKFGIFIHWGVYAVPAFANEWYPRNMYIQGSAEFEHHVATYGPHTEFGYKDFIPLFGAEQFDPAAWAELFRRAGARFVVPVAEHHDGFAMYDCSTSRWTSVHMGPKRDIVGELAQAVRREGMVFGLSSHRAEHWWFMNGGRAFPSDVQDPANEDFYGPAHQQPDCDGTQQNTPELDSQPFPDKAFLDDWLARTCELVDKYQPQLVWFDWWIEQPAFAPYLQRFAAYYYNRAAEWGLGVAINYKNEAFPPEAAVFDIERGQLTDLRMLEVDEHVTVMAKVSKVDRKQYRDRRTGRTADRLEVVGALDDGGLSPEPRVVAEIPFDQRGRQLVLAGKAWQRANGDAQHAQCIGGQLAIDLKNLLAVGFGNWLRGTVAIKVRTQAKHYVRRPFGKRH